MDNKQVLIKHNSCMLRIKIGRYIYIFQLASSASKEGSQSFSLERAESGFIHGVSIIPRNQLLAILAD